MPAELADLDAFNKALADAGDKAIIIDFYADWCGPCKMVAPKYVAFGEQYPNVITYKVNVDDAEDIAAKCEISAMPTFAVFKNGEEVDKLLGANVEALEGLFKKYN